MLEERRTVNNADKDADSRVIAAAVTFIGGLFLLLYPSKSSSQHILPTPARST